MFGADQELDMPALLRVVPASIAMMTCVYAHAGGSAMATRRSAPAPPVSTTRRAAIAFCTRIRRTHRPTGPVPTTPRGSSSRARSIWTVGSSARAPLALRGSGCGSRPSSWGVPTPARRHLGWRSTIRPCAANSRSGANSRRRNTGFPTSRCASCLSTSTTPLGTLGHGRRMSAPGLVLRASRRTTTARICGARRRMATSRQSGATRLSPQIGNWRLRAV